MQSSYAPQGQNPYASAGTPGAYAGSGYADMGGPPPGAGSYGPPAGSNPYAAGQYQDQPGALDSQGLVDPGADNAYKQFTEGSTSGQPTGKIDPETGIAPRRITDCVCLPIFAVFVIMMMSAAGWAGARGDPERLKRGFDYRGRLCGNDIDDDKGPGQKLGKYVFYCRALPNDVAATPGELNTLEPICVSQCPVGIMQNMSCLEQQKVRPELSAPNYVSPAFGVVQSYFVHAQQSVVVTSSYATAPFQGRYCLPTDGVAKDTLLHGPINFFVRAYNALGSFSNCWGILTWTSFVALMLGAAYVSTFRFCGKFVIISSLLLTVFVLVTIGLCCLVAIPVYLSPSLKESSLPFLANYQDNNPLYSRNGERTATIMSGIIGLLALIGSAVIGGMLQHVEGHYIKIQDLVEVSWAAVFAMKELLLWPTIAAFFRLLLLYTLCKNFMYLVTIGTVDKRRIVINGLKYYSASAEFQFDYWSLPVIIFYAFGSVWLLELCHSFCHFMLSYAVILWYYTPKDDNGEKTDVYPYPTLHGLWVAVRYHMGSLILGSLLIPYMRVPRVSEYVLCDNLPTEEDECLPPFGCCSCFGKAMGKCCHPMKDTFDFSQTGAIMKFSKNAFNDVVLRSNHYLDAARRSLNVLNGDPIVAKNWGSCRVVSLVGVVTIGMCGGAFAWLLATSFETYSNEDSESYIQDPLMVSFMGFFVSGCIAYNYTMLLDHTADILLFCYSWNKRFKRGNADKYVPDDLRNVVGSDDKNPDSYPLYGSAPNNMYLCTWMSTGGQGQPAPVSAAPSPQDSMRAPDAGDIGAAPRAGDYRPVAQQDYGGPYGGYGGAPNPYGSAPNPYGSAPGR